VKQSILTTFVSTKAQKRPNLALAISLQQFYGTLGHFSQFIAIWGLFMLIIAHITA
jgi:hypothetical protein